MRIFNILSGCRTAEHFFFGLSFVKKIRNAPFLLYWLEFYLLVLPFIDFPPIKVPGRVLITERFSIIIYKIRLCVVFIVTLNTLGK